MMTVAKGGGGGGVKGAGLQKMGPVGPGESGQNISGRTKGNFN